MPGSKRNKSKKGTSATPTDLLPLPDDKLVDGLFAELDLKDKQESATEPASASVNKIEAKIESSPKKQNSKVRHLARQVSAARSPMTHRVYSRLFYRHERRRH